MSKKKKIILTVCFLFLVISLFLFVTESIYVVNTYIKPLSDPRFSGIDYSAYIPKLLREILKLLYMVFCFVIGVIYIRKIISKN